MSGARLGQHFLIHSWAATALAHAAHPLEGETILEIGPGKGILTRELLKHGPVVAVEKDEELVDHLRQVFRDDIQSGKLRIVSDDVRNVSPRSLGLSNYVVAANIPYYITGEIIRQFLTSDVQPRAMGLLIQKEVAQRITDTKGSILAMSVKAYGRPRIVEKVPKKHFSPPPKVDSAILAIEDISRDFFAEIEEKDFFLVLRTGFASKRKLLSNNLSTTFSKDKVLPALHAANIDEKARAEDLDIQGWRSLTRSLT